MILFLYDHTFDGLLTVVFEAYERKCFPDVIPSADALLPLFYDEVIEVLTDKAKAERVWKGLEKRLSPAGLSVITSVWLSELPEMPLLLFRYMRKAIDATTSIELNFGDPDVLKASQIGKKVQQERHRVIQFVRFQKMADGIFFSTIEPLYNVLPISVSHFKERFADQKWLLYDVKRGYGYFYDLCEVTEVWFEESNVEWLGRDLRPELLDKDEEMFRKMWKEYFRSITIRERINPKLHRQNLPVRFWKYLPEKK